MSLHMQAYTHPFQAGPSKGKQRYMNRFFDSEISGQCRNKSRNHERITHSEHPSSSCLFDIRTFFSSIRRSSGKGKQKARQPKQKAPGVVDVPLGEATYQDVVGVDDGTRPYVLFFCLSWFQGKKKKPDPPRPVYDDELEDDESEEAILSVPIPTNRVQPPQQQEIELKPVATYHDVDLCPKENMGQHRSHHSPLGKIYTWTPIFMSTGVMLILLSTCAEIDVLMPRSIEEVTELLKSGKTVEESVWGRVP
ncbi:hypothetical protein EDB19DRAFT_1830341 [Suillus lakei]|nr:hypothetical protein EDB19DRAFT_1830341 [Suillus lakei]